MELDFQKSANNDIVYSGKLVVLEEIKSEIDLVLETNRCSLDMKTCEKSTTLNIRKICPKLKEKDQLYSKAISMIEPPLECPIKPGNYTSKQSSIEFKKVALLPIDGYVWIVTIKLVSSGTGNKAKRLILCLNAEVKIIKTRIRP